MIDLEAPLFTAGASFALLAGGSLVARQAIERYRPLQSTDTNKSGVTEQSAAPQVAINAAQPTSRPVLAWSYLVTCLLPLYWGATILKWLVRHLPGRSSGKTPVRLEGGDPDNTENRNAQLRTVAMAHISNGAYNKGSVGEAVDTAAKTLATFAVGAVLGVWANGLAAAAANGGSAAAAGPLVRAVAVFLWGGAVLRSFMIFHDAGHGSFARGSQFSRWLNWVSKHVFAAGCATPTDWGVGHRLHHMNMGNAAQDSYDWGETIFHTVGQYRSMPSGLRFVYRVLRHPAVFFPIAPVLTWYVKMRLPIELRPNRPAAYRFSDKMLSIALMAARYYTAYRFGILDVVGCGDYCAMLAGVVLFHWQHVYEHGYVINAVDGLKTENPVPWDRYAAAFDGSSFLQVHPFFKFFTLGIEYHHIHHLDIRVPGHALRRCHDEAPVGLWDELGIVKLELKDCWASLFMTLWDEKRDIFVPFSALEPAPADAPFPVDAALAEDAKKKI